MLIIEELDRAAAEDEKRLGIGSGEFMKRHREIMELCDAAQILPMCAEMERGFCDAST